MRLLEQRQRNFAQVASALLWVFAIGFAVGAVQVGRAIWSHRVWINYRGELISQAAMRRELVFMLLAAIVCSLLAWYWRRVWRRRL